MLYNLTNFHFRSVNKNFFFYIYEVATFRSTLIEIIVANESYSTLGIADYIFTLSSTSTPHLLITLNYQRNLY